MKAFISTFRPRSVQAKDKKKKAAFYQKIQNDFRKYHPEPESNEKNLYGVVYYFHRRKTQLDADNISKPVWDALIGEAYEDDFQIRFRSSGLFHFGVEVIEVLDLTKMPEYLISDFINLIDNGNDHIIYVEFGDFSYDLIKFAIN